MKKRHRILGVDDDPLNRIILADYLEEDYEVTLAESGEHCLEILETMHPDLILLDIMMPGINGYEVCQQVRADQRLRHTKIILISAKALPEERLKGYEVGANDYVTKPFSGDELLAKVRVYLDLASVEELDELKSQFLTLLSHETRTPLSGIVAAADMLVDMLEPGSEEHELARIIDESAQRWKHTIKTALRICELKAGQVLLRPDAADLEELAREVIENVSEIALAKQLVIDSKTCDGPLPIHADRKLVSEALECLLRRSVRMSQEGHQIEVCIEDLGSRVAFSVRDDTAPVAEELRPYIFESLAVSDLDHHSGETELDLALANCIAQTMGGEAEASFGERTTYSISLPTGRTAEAEPATREPNRQTVPSA